MYIGTATGVVSVAAVKRKTEPELCVWDRLNAVLGAPWKKTPGAQREGDEVPAARYPIAEGGGEQPLPVQPAVLGLRNVCIRAGVGIDKYGATLGCQGCDAILMRSKAMNHSTECRENHDRNAA